MLTIQEQKEQENLIEEIKNKGLSDTHCLIRCVICHNFRIGSLSEALIKEAEIANQEKPYKFDKLCMRCV